MANSQINKQKPEVSFVLPCLNEAETLEKSIRKAQICIREHHLAAEVVVADNGSTDGSQEIAERCGARVIPVEQKGYGSALMGGFEASHGEYIIMGDADDSYDFSAAYPFVEKLREGNDLVMGSRMKGQIMPGAMPWKHKWIGNPVLTGIGRLFFKCPASDFHSGLRAFRRDAYERMDLRTTGMEFASEMVIKATLRGMKISEVPITLYKDGRSRPPHLRSWRDGWRHLRFMLLYCPHWLYLVPGCLLIVLGMLLGGLIWTGPKQVGGVEFDVHTMLYAAAMVIIGFQAIAFSFFAKVFAISEGLLPESPRLTKLFRYITLEVGLIVGVVLALGGLAGSIAAVWQWRSHSFGAMDPSRTLRLVVPSVLGLALGAEIIFSSFFLSILGLRMKRTSAAPESGTVDKG